MAHVRSDELVASALQFVADGVSAAETAAFHGVRAKTVQRWQKLYVEQGRPRGQAQARVPCPRCTEAELSLQPYAELFGWYLGDGHISRQRRGVFGLHIYNDARYEVDNLRLLSLMELVKPGGRPHRRNAPGCVITTVSWKHWPCLFPQHGPGRKNERHLGMKPWQWSAITTFPVEFLRGLFHSDGCLVQNRVYKNLPGGRKAYVYPRWQFVNASDEIRGWCCDALDMIGIAWKQSNPRVISVSRREDVARLTALIGEKA